MIIEVKKCSTRGFEHGSRKHTARILSSLAIYLYPHNIMQCAFLYSPPVGVVVVINYPESIQERRVLPVVLAETEKLLVRR